MAEEPKTKYRVRQGFVVFPRDGGDPLEGGSEIELTAADAEYFAAQIELADPDLIKKALAAEAAAAKAAEDAAKAA